MATKKVKEVTTNQTSKKKGHPKFTPAQVSEALEKSMGLVATAARKLNCQRSTVYDYIDKYPEVKDTLDMSRELLIDGAEIGLAKAIKDVQPWAVCFALKTIGRNRGYVERQEIEQQTRHSMEPEMSAMLDKMFQGKE